MFKCYIIISYIYTGKLFPGCAVFVVYCNIRALWETKKEERLSCRKSTKKNLCEGHHFFNCIPSLLCHFLLLSLSDSPSQVMYLLKWMTPMKIYNISMGGILCDIENMKISCNLIIAGWHLKEHDLILDFFLASVIVTMTLN